MNKFLLVASGGAIGSALRYAVWILSHQISKTTFPVGILAVNSSGALLVGFLWGLFSLPTIEHELVLA